MKLRLFLLLLSVALPLSATAGQSSLMLGLGAGSAAEYQGSDDSETTALPYINWEWQRDPDIGCGGGFGLHRAFAGVDGVGAAFWCADKAAFTVSAGYDAGRDSGDSDYLDGLPDVDGGVSAGLGFAYGDDDGFTFSIEAASVDSDLVATAEVGYPLLGFLDASVGVNYADKGRMQKYFGVTGNDSMNMAGAAMGECAVVATGNANYRGMDYCSDLGGGIYSWTVSLETFIPLPFQDGESWAVNIGIDHTTLIGDAADSPLVRDKSDTAFSIAVIWMHSF